jgi:hypothetical protein
MVDFIKKNSKTIAGITVILIVALVILAAMVIFLPYGIDWSTYFRPAARAMLSGKSPYDVPGFFNPPWALIPLLPLALLPESLGRAALFLISFGSMALIVRRLGATSILAVTAFLCSLPVGHGLFNANIDWLVMLGFIMPPQFGMLFACIKPQVGMAVIFFWIVEALRRGGVREALRISMPLILLTLVSLLIYGWWPGKPGSAVIQGDTGFNSYTWPLSVPFGLIFLALSMKTRNIRWSMPASPCLAPYAAFHSWAAALVALARHPRAMAAVSALTWLVPVVLYFIQTTR